MRRLAVAVAMLAAGVAEARPFVRESKNDKLCRAIGETSKVALQPRDRLFFEERCGCASFGCAESGGQRLAYMREVDACVADVTKARHSRSSDKTDTISTCTTETKPRTLLKKLRAEAKTLDAEDAAAAAEEARKEREQREAAAADEVRREREQREAAEAEVAAAAAEAARQLEETRRAEEAYRAAVANGTTEALKSGWVEHMVVLCRPLRKCLDDRERSSCSALAAPYWAAVREHGWLARVGKTEDEVGLGIVQQGCSAEAVFGPPAR